MGQFKAKQGVIMRDMERLTIIFKDRETIWVLPKDGSTNVIFHRWWAPIGSYKAGWGQFRRLLYREKKLDIATCYRLAHRYGIQSMGTTRAPTIKGPIKLKIHRKLKRRTSK